MKQKSVGIVAVLIILIGMSSCTQGWVRNHAIEITGEHSFIDSIGNEIIVDAPYEKVITLYSAHTENAFAFGSGASIIGVNTTSVFPAEAASLPRYDYKSDPEPLIAAEPDLVIVRPFINRNYNDYIRAIEKAGIPVVSLYPVDQSSFEAYVTALGILFGEHDAVVNQLALLDEQLHDIIDITSVIPIEDRVVVYFESTKTAYRTVTVDSNPARGIVMAGGINIASDAEPITKGSTISEFGIEKLMMVSAEIDVYISQRGAMNAGGSLISIPQREGFSAIKAVEEGKILELNEKLISSPTFRYYKGVREMARMFYPELLDDVSAYNTDEPINREAYACLTVKLKHTPIFVPSSSHYYEQNHKVHTYGYFTDVHWQDMNFDYIETAVLNSYLREYNATDGSAYFDPEGIVTRGDLAYTLYIMGDIRATDSHIDIVDIESCIDDKIVQKVIDGGFMTLDDQSNFNPDMAVTGQEVIRGIEQLLSEAVTSD